MNKPTMIPRTEERWQSWQEILAQSTLTLDELLSQLDLTLDQLPERHQAMNAFPLRVPQPFIDRMQKGDANDPLLLQVLPQAAELEHTPGFSTDPLNEIAHNPVSGVVHKYHGRVLLIASSACAINCRYCFRRHFPYEDNNPSRTEWQNAIDYITSDTSITEVILSGGDPLVNSDKQLAWLLQQIEHISHVTRLRVHTRLPIVLPQRCTTELVDILSKNRLHTSVVVHTNHANELDNDVGEALRCLSQAGLTLLNQTVLMRGINDNVATLQALSEQLFTHKVLPYYLHVLDKVQGTAHFDVSDETAIQLISNLRAQLPGYLIPKLVKEEAGKTNKTPLC